MLLEFDTIVRYVQTLDFTSSPEIIPSHIEPIKVLVNEVCQYIEIKEIDMSAYKNAKPIVAQGECIVEPLLLLSGKIRMERTKSGPNRSSELSHLPRKDVLGRIEPG